jgi:hypothetical protein
MGRLNGSEERLGQKAERRRASRPHRGGFFAPKIRQPAWVLEKAAICPLDQKRIGKYKPHKGVTEVAFDLMTLIMLIVPGFWSMWIYQSHSYKDIDRNSPRQPEARRRHGRA